MSLFRPHMGSFVDSMFEAVAVYSKRELIDIINSTHIEQLDDIDINSYGGRDPRNSWDTHIVTRKNGGVIGFTNGGLRDVIK